MLGFHIHDRTRAVDAATVKKFLKLPVANISDVMFRMTAGGPRLRPMHDGTLLGGAAVTIKTRPGDNLLVHKAINLAGPGDVLVVDAGGDLTNAIIGEIMAGYAQGRKIAGMVINGAIRDAATLRSGNFPVYAAGVTHRGPYKDGPGEINVPVSIDGMVVNPGDLILGDADGLLCVPYEQLEEIYKLAAAKHAEEEVTLADIAAGKFDTNGWVDARLSALGCGGLK